MNDQISAAWRKSSYSSGNGGACVEAGHAAGAVLVRDTTQNGAGPVLRVTPAAWSRLVRSVKDGPACA
jgi:Domain of unknown function (DUF397)